MPQYNTKTAVADSNSQLPQGTYIARVLKFDHQGPNSAKYKEKGYEMTTLTCEIVQPDKVTLPDGTEARSAGRRFNFWLMWNSEESWGTGRNITAIAKMLGISKDEVNINTDDPESLKLVFGNRHFQVILSSEENIKRAERQKGEKQGKPILDAFGKEIKDGWRVKAQLDDIAGPYQEILPPVDDPMLA